MSLHFIVQDLSVAHVRTHFGCVLCQVVLDLDETLVCAYPRNKVPPQLLYSSAKSMEVSYNLGNGRIGNVVVFPRPGVGAFLESLSTFAELIVFTAGHAGLTPHPAWPVCSS